jgi:DNA-binding NarL/FixJ family response regulator
MLPKLEMPVLLVHETKYAFGSFELVQRMAAAIKGALFVSAVYDAEVAAIDTFLQPYADECRRAREDSRRVDDAAAGGLSSREIEVLQLLTAGKSNQQVADQLVISLNTVRRHVSNIFVKTGAANRADAVSYAHRNRLV